MQDFAAHSIGHIAPQTILYEGRYRIDLLLAAAPTRAVYRAWDLVQQRPATILELATPDLTIAAAALQRSAPLVQLDHAALTPIQVIFVEKGMLFFALALAGGQTIERIMAERANPITPAAAVRWIAQAAEGVEFLDRELPTWHLGDLSPAALLVTAEDRVQLLSFEVALGLLTPQTLAATLPAGAVAPELAAGRCDARSDVYGLAATLYFLLTRQRWTAQRESLANARADLSRALVATVMRGLAEEPAARWPDAATFYQELLRSLSVNHPAQRGAPWWDDDHPPLDGLAEEPPTIISTRDQLRAAVAAQQAALGITAAETTVAQPETSAPLAPPPIDTYIVMSPDEAHTDTPVAAPSTDESVTPTDLAEDADASQATPDAAATEPTNDGERQPETRDIAEQASVIPTYPFALATPEPREATPPQTTEPDAAMPEPQADAAPLPDAPVEEIVTPEPVAPTIIRPRWPWSDVPADAPSDDTPSADQPTDGASSPAPSTDAAEPTPIGSSTPAAPAIEPVAVTPESPVDPLATPPPAENSNAASTATVQPFADTMLRWSPLLIPAIDAANHPAVTEPAEQPTAPQPTATTDHATTVDNQPQEERVDLTALPTQIITPKTTEDTGAAVSDAPTTPPPYSPWDDAPTPATPNTPVMEPAASGNAVAPHLMLDDDIVAATPANLTASDTPPTTFTSTPDTSTTTPAPSPAAEQEQVIVAHSDYMSSEPPPIDPPKTSKTPSRPLGSSLLDKLRGILHTPGQMPALATGTVVVPRHMYPQHTYSVLVRLQCRPASATTSGESTKKEATFIIVEVESANDAFYVPVRRLALRLPNEGGLSEGTFTITALRPSATNETDPITFTFRSVDNQLLHEGQFLADISILVPQQLAGGNPMLTLVHALDIEQALA